MKTYYDGVVGLSPYLDVTGGFYRRLEGLYKENNLKVLTVRFIEPVNNKF